MPKLYRYVGPPHVLKQATVDAPRTRVDTVTAAFAWATRQPDLAPDGAITATFVVRPDGLWVADRHSEHVACAAGQPVHSAGEITFAVDRRRTSVGVAYVTNQSTGYCPEPESWPAVGRVLDSAGLAHPGEFTATMTFRRCVRCRATNLVKDGWFVCDVCGADLPAVWNFEDAIP